MAALRSIKKIARQINKRLSMVNSAVMCEVLERRQLLTALPTATVVTSSSSSTTFGGSVTLTATVTGTAGTAPTGTVIFDKGATNLGSGTLGTANASAGTCTWTLTTTTLPAGSDVIVAAYKGDSTDLASNSSGFTQTVAKATPTVTFADPSDITYGTALSGTQLDATVSGSLPGTIAYSNTSGAVLAAGSAEAITATFTPTDATDYNTATATAHINVTAKALTVTGVTAANKTYNRSTSAVVNASHGTLVGLVTGDAGKVTLVTSGVGGAFSGSDVGNGLTVTVSGLTLGGIKAGDYTITQPVANANISAAALTVTGITAVGKIYDGGTTATLNTSSPMLVGVVTGDSITLVSNAATGTFANSNVSSSGLVVISGLTVTGNTHLDYTLIQPTANAAITAKSLTVTGITAADKTYDGATTATLNTSSAALSGVVTADNANVTLGTTSAVGVFASSNASGSAQAVAISGLKISGSAALDYTLTQPATTAKINAKALTVTGITAANKVYNGSTGAVMNGSHGALVGIVSGDATKVTLVTGGLAGTFSGIHAGNALTVTVTGLTLSGAKSADYTVTQPTATANISSQALTVTGITAAAKIYDGGTTATLNTSSPTLVGVVSGDTITLVSNGASGAFANSNVSSSALVVISGLSVTGNTHGDYTLIQPTATTAITAKSITVTGITAADKTYDGKTTATLNTSSAVLSGVVTADTSHITLAKKAAVGAFASANASGSAQTVTVSGLTISGTAALDYTLTQPTTTAKINRLALTVTGITAAGRIYNGSTGSVLNSSHGALVGIVKGDTVGLVTSSLVGTFAASNVGTGVTVTTAGLSLNGSSATNYTVTDPTLTANITPLNLTVTGITAANKTFDSTTKATLSLGGATLVGVVHSDSVTLVHSAAVGSFPSDKVATLATVTISGLTLAGNTLGNYTLTQPITTATISAKTLVVSGISATDKVYDGTTTDVLDISTVGLAGLLAGDNTKVTLATSGAKGTFANANVGSGITVTISGLKLSGADSADYTISAAASSANITPKSVTITGITAAGKTYNGSTAAVLTTTGAKLAGVLTADASAVTLNSSSAVGTFSTKNVGKSLIVNIGGLALTGSAAGNYVITAPTTKATITQATLTVSGLVANNKVYNGTNVASLNASGASLVGTASGDTVTLVTAGSTSLFSNKSAGSSIPVTITGLTLSGADAANYILTQPTSHANITPRVLTISGITADDKVFDGTTVATLETDTAELAGVLASDSGKISLVTTGAVGTFASANTGTGVVVTITGITLSGIDAGDYTLIVDPTAADIT